MDKISIALNVSKGQLVELSSGSHGLALGEKIRLLREEKNLKLADLGEKVGISVSYLSEIERGNVYPSVKTINKLTDVLDVSVSSLVGTGGALGGKLKQVRAEQGLTQSQLADAAGVSPGLIGQIEHGRVQPSLQTIEKIASVLGTSPCYFIVDDAGSEEMLQLMSTEVRELLQDSNVQSILRMACNCTERELRFILDFIKLYKKEGAEY